MGGRELSHKCQVESAMLDLCPWPDKHGLYGSLAEGGRNAEEPPLMLPLGNCVSLNATVPSPVEGDGRHRTCLPGVL